MNATKDNRMKNSLRYVCSLFLLMILSQACAKNSLVSSQVDHSFAGPVTGTILVIGVFKDPTTHKIYEDSFVEEINKAGGKALPGSHYGLGQDSPDIKKLKQVMQESGASALLITHLIDEKKASEELRPMEEGQINAVYWDKAHQYHRLVYNLSWDPELTVTSKVDLMMASLFDWNSGSCVWSARSKSTNLDAYLRKNDEQLEDLFINDMKRHQLL
jgi:uncharacterized membrane protein